MRLEIARVSSTPLHYMHLTSNPPSGEVPTGYGGKIVRSVETELSLLGYWEDVVEFAIFIQSRKVIELNAQLGGSCHRSRSATIPSAI